LGLFVEAIPLGDEAIQIADSMNHASSLELACWGAGLAHLRRGNLAGAITRLERAMTLNPLPLHFRYVAPVLGSVYVLSGKLPEAIVLLEQAVEKDVEVGYVAHHVLSLVGLGEAYLVASRLSEAIDAATRAVEMARRRSERGHEAYALRLLGDIALRSDHADIEQAERHYQAASGVATDLGMRLLIAHCHLGLGKLYRRTGKREQAREHLTTATTMYREMDMRFWLEKTQAGMD
jgi:tetratricopeptide (TPR) repeat protein